MAEKLLTVHQVQTVGEGEDSDGGGLMLHVRGVSVIWVLRFTAPSGRRRETGLGPGGAATRRTPARASPQPGMLPPRLARAAAARDRSHRRRHALGGVRVGWRRVFEDFAFLEMTVDAVAERVGLRGPLLERIAAGRAQPSSNAADRMASLCSHLTSKPLQFLPRTEVQAGTLQPMENIESNTMRRVDRQRIWKP